MSPEHRLGLAAAILAVLVSARAGAHTTWVPVDSAPGDSLTRHVVSAAAIGDTVRLAPGLHRGPLRITRAIVLTGMPGAVVDGGGHGTVIEIGASGTVIESLEVRDSGRRVMTIDSGIHVLRASDVHIVAVNFEDVLYGIYGERADGLRVERCSLRGRVAPLDEMGEGNGIHLWYCRNTLVRRCDAEHFLDGIYLSFADSARVDDSCLHDCGRYGLHTMYCQQNTFVRDTLTHNAAGCAIMFSNHLEVADALIVHNQGPRTYGLLLRDCSDGWFHHSRLVDNTIAVFMDGSNRNRLVDNLIQDNGWGVLMFASCADNVVARNDFINNDYPVALDMRRTRNAFDDGGNGNFWSEAAPYDLDGDGLSDVAYSPVSAFSFASKQFPDLSVLAKSPAVAALGVAERVFPALRPSEALDHYPRVHPAFARVTTARSRAATRPRVAWPAVLLSGLGLAAGVAAFRGGRHA